MHAERIHRLNDKPARPNGGFVLYWMQQSQRAEWNHALEYAIERANQLDLPVTVIFCLMDDYPEANERHYAFMLEGLAETFESLKRRGIQPLIGRGDPPDKVAVAGKSAALIVCDQGYLRHQSEWRAQIADRSECEVVEVESDIVVPVETVSDHAEYMARTIRPKIFRGMKEFLTPIERIELSNGWNNFPTEFQGLEDFTSEVPTLEQLDLDRSVKPVKIFKGGTSRAKKRLEAFLESSLDMYQRNSNQPQTDDISHISPYLHFGQISPVYIAIRVKHANKNKEATDAYLEQLLVRRELAINFVWFRRDYDRLDALPLWAQRTLEYHKKDRREFTYTREEFEASATHDPYWNAAMDAMRATGFMHNYMRMYWGKKILEWTESPAEAFRIALHLNNRYFLDGRDANSYAGVGWIFGKHDQAWKERPVFGKTRYMNANGLRRKCDMDAYLAKVEHLKSTSHTTC